MLPLHPLFFCKLLCMHPAVSYAFVATDLATSSGHELGTSTREIQGPSRHGQADTSRASGLQGVCAMRMLSPYRACMLGSRPGSAMQRACM